VDEKKRILVIGGSGHVGSLVLPHLAEAAYAIRVFDLKPPRDDLDVEYVQGDLRDYDTLRTAVDGCDALVFMAMGPFSGWGEPANVWAHFEVATAGLFHALRAADAAGIRQAVYTSSMSVYNDPGDDGTYPSADHPPTATDFYGLAKRFGEQVGEAAVTAYGMSVVALRLCFPTGEERWPRTDGVRQSIIATSARDTARAILAGLEREGNGFETFAISGDAAGRMIDLTPARETLGWEPLDPTS
jgi:nucleoside-diphosphate-sugar epimerase